MHLGIHLKKPNPVEFESFPQIEATFPKIFVYYQQIYIHNPPSFFFLLQRANWINQGEI